MNYQANIEQQQKKLFRDVVPGGKSCYRRFETTVQLAFLQKHVCAFWANIGCIYRTIFLGVLSQTLTTLTRQCMKCPRMVNTVLYRLFFS